MADLSGSRFRRQCTIQGVIQIL